MCSIPTTVLWTSRILGLVVLLCSAQLLTQAVVHLQILKLSGTFPMDLRSYQILTWHSPELGLLLLEQYVSTVTLRLPQQESSAVTYLMPVETYRVSMWGYILPIGYTGPTQVVSPVHWRAACKISLIWAAWDQGVPVTEKHVCCV